MDTINDRLVIAGREFKSRLWVGTGKYKDFVETKKAIEASGADVVTVAVRRVNITDRSKENLLDYLDPKKYIILPKMPSGMPGWLARPACPIWSSWKSWVMKRLFFRTPRD